MFLLRGLSNLSCWNPGIVDAMQHSTPFCSAQIDWLIDWLIDFLPSCNWRWIGLIDGLLLLAWCKFHKFRQPAFPLQLNNPTNLECKRETCELVSALYKDNGLGGGGGGAGCWWGRFGYKHMLLRTFTKYVSLCEKSNIFLNELDFSSSNYWISNDREYCSYDWFSAPNNLQKV